jgi:hypothetical protein
VDGFFRPCRAPCPCAHQTLQHAYPARYTGCMRRTW